MHVYIGGPLRIKKFRNLALYETIANIIRELGFNPYIPHIETADPDKKAYESKIYRENIQALNDSLFAIFEITYPSHGVGMEIQHALSKNIPFLCIAKERAVISKMLIGTIEPFQIEYYSNPKELKVKLKRKISEELRLRDTCKIGRFITVEGIDYTGKSTICQKLYTKLSEQKRNVILICDPPLIQPWQELKQFFEKQEKISKLSESILLLSARLDNYERIIKPAIRRGDIIIGDRYIDSWFAYQSYRLRSYFNNTDKAMDFLAGINDFLFRYSFLSLPDLTILIIDDPKKTLKRANSRSSVSKYEEIEIQSAAQNIYLRLAEKFHSRFRIIDAKGKNIDAVFKEVHNLCNNLLGVGNEH